MKEDEKNVVVSKKLPFEQQMEWLYVLITTGVIHPNGRPIWQLLMDYKEDVSKVQMEIPRPTSTGNPLPIPEYPQNAGEAARRQQAIQLFLKNGWTYEDFIESFGPFGDKTDVI
jgi:hypothetical protein